MLGKKLTGAVFLLMLFAAPCLIAAGGGTRALLRAAGSIYAPLGKLETAMTEQFPAADRLRKLEVSLSYMGGQKEQNGVFISGDSLTLDVQPKSLSVINDNTLAMIDFADEHQIPSYVMLIPTACAVQQSKVPYDKVAPLYNQRQLIDDVYRRVSGRVTAIDVYPTLFNHQDEYIYYNTDNTITGLGGYYIYSAAAKNLLRSNPRGLDQYEVEHLDYNYYGDLYALSPYREVSADRVSVYSYVSRFQRDYIVTHYDASGIRRYYTLYPRFRAELGDSMAVVLGGMSPVIDISIIGNTTNSKRLLLFGDRSVQGYVPFLLAHYERVTVVDTTQAAPEQLGRINLRDYSQVLFAWSVDHYVTADQLSLLDSLDAARGS
ncbi:hypothetical protein D3Z39_03620 [Anaerotruncus colihominis]|uniref:AlgX/AlgJ SGNH hydrolase-like domain-containing protein n=2 Tax=Anaerotruncus colihominis TaxID=169435 RepID=A0A845RE74_9FIRM|nr:MULTISPECIES: DHHW family protein [Anaerotruncus]MCI8492466.1 hypothetical protein [Anaerotruncus sp.]NBI77973.1 hypothetical protein [Anaerotruncus colihominis]